MSVSEIRSIVSSSVRQDDSGFRFLHTAEDTTNGVFWSYMHKRSANAFPGYRPCFSTQLLKEMRQHQIRIADSLRRPLRDSAAPRFRHLVLASEADVFNLGG